MNILDTIIAHKKEEVVRRRREISISELEKMTFFNRIPLSLKDFLSDKEKTGIIAEFKRKSPSKGIINDTSSAKEVTAGYTRYGASALSVLTDERFFGGSLDDLLVARENNLPLLRKDFIIDEYQIVEAKAYGADIILLIAACLTREEVKQLAIFARDLGMNVLLEIHDHAELGHICDEVNFVGINNRNLKDFKVDLDHSIRLGSRISSEITKIAESGIHDPQTVKMLCNNGFEGFLIGEKFMKEKDPAEAFKIFAEAL